MLAAALEEIVARHADREGPLLPILHDVQREQGYIGEADVRQIARVLNLSRAEVSGVVSFYHDFRRAPEPLPVLRLCRAEACQARGGEALARRAEKRLAGRGKVEPVYCLGLCSVGPSAMVGHTIHARLDPDSLDAMIESMA